jgi:hypothetical membrane protein
MDKFLQLFTDPVSFPIWGIAGTILVIAGCIIPSLKYKGRQKQRFSPLNHFISELGERKVSAYARVFNLSLVAAGLLFVMYMIQFGFFLGTVPAVTAAATGVFSALACSMVGVFPMDTRRKHDDAAMCFFNGGLVTILLFGLSSLLDDQRRLPLIFILFAVLVALAFAAFILLPASIPKSDKKLDLFGTDRPKVWPRTIVEWLAMLGVVGWIAAVSLYFI